MNIWKVICQTCKTVMFTGNIPHDCEIHIQCPNCGDIYKAWGIPHSVPMLVTRWTGIVELDDP